jgi:16S rRNA processing protein RimM
LPRDRILLGVIGRPHGVRGLARVHSYTADPVDLAAYGDLSDESGQRFRLRWMADGVAEISRLDSGTWNKVTDRAEIERLTNRHLYIDRAAMPSPPDDEFYLADLVGLAAFNGETPLGRVAMVHDYGAGASLEIERPGAPPLLVPFTRDAVPVVDLAAGRVVVFPPAEVSQ